MVRKLTQTERMLRNARNRFLRSKSGAEAFLPTVSEYRKMNKQDRRFYSNAVRSLNKKSPYQRSRDIYKARTAGKLINKFNKASGFSQARKDELNSYSKQAKEMTLALDAQRAGIYGNGVAQGLSKKKKERLVKRHEMRAENLRDYADLTLNNVLYQKVKVPTGGKTKTGKPRVRTQKFKFKKFGDVEMKDKILKYDAYTSQSSNGYVVITDNTKPALNGSPHGSSAGLKPLMEEMNNKYGHNVARILEALGQLDE